MKKTLAVINEMKKQKIIEDYAIAGGIATIFYVEPILTYDLDIFFTYKTEPTGLDVLKPIYKCLRKKGYKEKQEHVLIEGIPVQFFPVYDALSREAVEQAQKTTYSSVSIKVLSAEHLIATRRFHRKRARMSFGMKIKQLVKLQMLANEIKSNTGREKGYIWQI
jgi:hypothetical protein